MRWNRQGYAAIAEVSRAVAERAITEREACVELAARTGREPRALLLAVRTGVKLFEGRAGQAKHAVGLEREIRRLRDAQRN
jgi:hypothetical protein